MSVFVILTPGFPKDESDTTCLPAFQQFALSLKKIRSAERIRIISFQYPYEYKEYVWNGISVISIGGSNRSGRYLVSTLFKATRIIHRIKRKYGIEGMLSLWLSECSLVGKYYASCFGLKHFSWLIGQDAKKNNKYISFIRPDGNNIIAMSDFLKEEFSKNYGILPGHTIENGINPEGFPEFNNGERTIDVMGAGWLSPLKNFGLFLELIAEAKKTHPGIRAVIAGEGPERKHLESFIQQLNLIDNVQLVGLTSHSETLRLMSQSKIFLHTSHYEGNSTVLMEALYSGCRVLSTQALSTRAIENLHVKSNRNDISNVLLELLNENGPAKKIVFNTMDESAKKILQLFDPLTNR